MTVRETVCETGIDLAGLKDYTLLPDSMKRASSNFLPELNHLIAGSDFHRVEDLPRHDVVAEGPVDHAQGFDIRSESDDAGVL